MGNRGVVDRWVDAVTRHDYAAQRELLHDEYVGRYPQSGEVIRGPENRIAIVANYPGWDPSTAPIHVDLVTGTDDQFITAPSAFAWTLVHLSGSGDEFTVTATVRYPDDSVWHYLSLVVERDGRIWRETAYFGEPFEAPDWRAAWVEREASRP
jgi:hypothetical protein